MAKLNSKGSLMKIFSLFILVTQLLFSENIFNVNSYHYNYFIPLMYDKSVFPSREQREAEFQISFKKKLQSNLFSDESYYFTYTQTSFWQIYSESAPFRESNYQPELLIVKPISNFYINQLTLAFNHQSNGQPIATSRSWNRLYLQLHKIYKTGEFDLKFWYRLPEEEKKYASDPDGDDNPDLLDYTGYGEFHFKKKFKNAVIDSNIRVNPNTGFGSVDLKLLYKASWINESYLLIKYFDGYGSSLIDYNIYTQRIGIGISITN